MAADDDSSTRVTVATLRGEMQTGFATITGAVNELATEVRMDREARDRADREHDRIHLDYSTRLSALETWRIEVTATENAAPRLTWAAFLRDTKGWVLALLAIAGGIYGFIE